MAPPILRLIPVAPQKYGMASWGAIWPRLRTTALEYRKMEKVQKINNLECYTSLSEPVRIYYGKRLYRAAMSKERFQLLSKCLRFETNVHEAAETR
jgi:hypothetical protein